MKGLALAALALLAAVLLTFGIGRFPVGATDLLAVLWAGITGTVSGRPAVLDTVVFGIRGPRVLAAVLAGAALAGAGSSWPAPRWRAHWSGRASRGCCATASLPSARPMQY